MKTFYAMCALLQSKCTNAPGNAAVLSLSLWFAWAGLVPMPAWADEHPQLKPGEINPEVIFRKSCSVCHGDRGNGRGRASVDLYPQPRDFTTATDLSRDRMITSVTYGRPGTAMMPWKTRYTAEQIASVVDYIRNRFMLVALDPHIETGRGVYGHFCQICHGDRAQGAASTSKADTPPDLTTPQNQRGLTRERMIASVTRGKHGSTITAGFSDKLTPENIEAVVDYMRRVLLPALAARDKDKPVVSTAADSPQNVPPPSIPSTTPPPPANTAKQADMSLPMPKGLVGDIKKGKRFFMGNCATCHGKLGNGEGPRAFFLNPRPRNFHDEYSHTNLNRPTIFSVVTTGKPGTVMPAWGKVLTDQEIANVAEFVFETFVQEKGGAKTKTK
jgi:mono/diheme cytochrome c family protein